MEDHGEQDHLGRNTENEFHHPDDCLKQLHCLACNCLTLDKVYHQSIHDAINTHFLSLVNNVPVEIFHLRTSLSSYILTHRARIIGREIGHVS